MRTGADAGTACHARRVRPARRVAVILLALCFTALLAGFIWGAITEKSETADLGGWVFLGMAGVFLAAAAVTLLVWRRARK